MALRMVFERQLEIEAFRPAEYWTVAAQLATPDGQLVPAALHQASICWLLVGQAAAQTSLSAALRVQMDIAALGKEGLPDKAAADRALQAVKDAHLQVRSQSQAAGHSPAQSGL